MGYCPNCRWEFEFDVMVCPDCGVQLTDGHPPRGTAAERPDRSWVVMGQVLTGAQSKMAKGSLDSNNIPSVLMPARLDDGGGSAPGKGVLGRVEDEGNLIMVPREFEQDAMIVLEAVLGDDLMETGRLD